MARDVRIQDPDDDDDEYLSGEDSDFAPDDAVDQDISSAESEDELAVAGTTPQKRPDGKGLAGVKSKISKPTAADAADEDLENSGDEAIIAKGKKKRRKDEKAAAQDDNDEGHVIKTRSMRAVETAERRAQPVSRGPVTVDVDALWAQMNAAPVEPSHATSAIAADYEAEGPAAIEVQTADPSDMIKIKRTYNFAGKVHTEEKTVARDSAEAKLYLASLSADESAPITAEADSKPRYIPRKAFRSRYEPTLIDPNNPVSHRTDLNLNITARLIAREKEQEAAAQKLTTVQKSRMDWVGFVDKEGIQDELDLAGRAKGNYAERQGFLARAEARLEEDARRARMAGGQKAR